MLCYVVIIFFRFYAAWLSGLVPEFRHGSWYRQGAFQKVNFEHENNLVLELHAQQQSVYTKVSSSSLMTSNHRRLQNNFQIFSLKISCGAEHELQNTINSHSNSRNFIFPIKYNASLLKRNKFCRRSIRKSKINLTHKRILVFRKFGKINFLQKDIASQK